MNILTSPWFLNQSSNHAEPVPPVVESEIRLRFNAKNQSVDMSCSGKIEVSYTENGEAKTDSYADLESTTVAIPCDSNTDVVIKPVEGGSITEIDLSNKNNLTYATINTALTKLDCSDCNALTSLNLSANTALTKLSCSYCYALTSLNLSANTALTELDCSDCAKIEEIKYPATNDDVSTAIAGLISDAESESGTVYTTYAWVGVRERLP